ncbi:oligopeptide transporter, OPT family [Gordonia pseudamarae]|jgi:putative OPT family oligopeptide transporter|uniref:OPT family oligopeptide transporter n=1 Tax=Gordonia TaxID=2053 RepID=UPI0019A6F747|nr:MULTISPECIES: oligopeptide transporter, OPT family [Gordonia]MBD0022955.1 oligopeptide transporter, OPT family [Gordonia sp. (in: high G+C Gram-positive bacteria)]QHN26728.1 oligopeptide transporter, OPT family [Gordonia pseudamarae]
MSSTETPGTGIPATTTVKEMTLRGIVLGGVITLVFTAANVYLGLRVGLTFATAIPAAVVSMAILRYFADHSVIENNIVQTIASAAGTLSAIIFVIPGLVMIGWWTGFPYWTTVAVCAIGGILGVMYSIPLRRALVTGSDLPYPEGVAAAEVLKVGDSTTGAAENKAGLRVILLGAVASAAYSLLTKLKVISDTVSGTLKIGTGGTLFNAGILMSLIGIGHLVGVAVGIAMLVGLLISYAVLLPIKSQDKATPGDLLSDVIGSVFSQEVRLIGAGAIAIAAIWTLAKIMGPIVQGMTSAMQSTRARREGASVDVTERDIPVTIVGGTILVLLIPIAFMLWDFAHDTVLSGGSAGIITVSVVFVFVIGLAVAAVCGYMAGLIGSSNSPISGVGILVVLIAAILIKATFGDTDETHIQALVAFTLFTAAIVFGVATISNDNLQDLKTGQLVGATPWKQQVALVIGVLFGSAVIPPILSLMYDAFGFVGAPGETEDSLAAPQAGLLKDLTQGVLGGDLDWALIGVGALIGAGVIVIDEVLARTTRFRLPPLAVGMGMYLPMAVTLIIPVGAFLGAFYNRWAERSGGNVEHKKRMGTLLATGLIVGEALFGVVFAGIVAATSDDGVLQIVGDGFDKWAQALGVIVFAGSLAWLYNRTQRISSAEPGK